MTDCIFCKIGTGQIPAGVVFQDEEVMAFEDLRPQAPVHVLIIPKRHIGGLNEAGSNDRMLLGRLLEVANLVAQRKRVAETGYRVVTNIGPNAGQSVFHLHVHLLGGRGMAWPPG
jgi:histidine triad (HIT) family protein